jgi:hypothetical protein
MPWAKGSGQGLNRAALTAANSSGMLQLLVPGRISFHATENLPKSLLTSLGHRLRLQS